MQQDCGQRLSELRVDGGAVANNFLMQFQADILGTCVERPKMRETTALGAAYLAGLACGFWSGLDELRDKAIIEREFSPQLEEAQKEKLYKGWQRLWSAPATGKSRLQAASCKLQAASCKLQAASCKLQAASCKLQAASCKPSIGTSANRTLLFLWLVTCSL